MRSDFRVMRDISNHTRVPPDIRGKELEKFISDASSNPEVSEALKEWGFSINPDMLEIPARVLPPETIIFRNKRQTVDPLTEEWSGACKNSHVISSVPLTNWLLIYPSRSRQLAKDFATSIAKAGSSIGFPIHSPTFLELKDDRRDAFVKLIKRNITDRTQFVGVILPNSQADRYDAIKQTCCLDLPTPSQCMLAK